MEFAPPPRPKRRLARWLLFGFLSFALSAGAVVACFMWNVARAFDKPVAALEAHHRDVAAGRVRDAYAATTDRYRRDVTFDQFDAFVKGHADLYRAPLALSGRELQAGVATLTASGVVFTIVNDAGAWKIDHIGF